MKIRAAVAADAPAVVAIWNDVIRNSATTFTSQEKSTSDVTDMIAAQAFLVAEHANRVIGFATFGPFRAGPGYARVAEHSIYIHPEAQGQNVGRALMNALETQARAQGVKHLIAGIGGEATQSIGFHARLGFEKVAHLPDVGWKFERAHDLILMQKRL